MDEFHQGMLIQLGCTEVIDGVNNTFDKQLSLTSNDCSLVKMFLFHRESSQQLGHGIDSLNGEHLCLVGFSEASKCIIYI